MKNEPFLSPLRALVENEIQTVKGEFLTLPSAALNWKPAPDEWSILECLEHLNRYNRFYNKKLERALATSSRPRTFRHGWLGGYFIRTVSPNNVRPMRTMERLNPAGSDLNQKTLGEFVRHQQHLLALLSSASTADLNLRRIPVEIMPLLRIKTGDALAFVITHQERHLGQALRVKARWSASLPTSEQTRING